MSLEQQNWAGSHTYGAARYERPEHLEQVQQIVSDAVGRGERVKPLGSRHSFTGVADTPGLLLDMRGLPADVRVDEQRATAIVSGGATYAQVAPLLHEAGFALANMASLPHISIAGAVATGTHGSGDRIPSLAAAVNALELVTGTGEVRTLRRGEAGFDGAVVGLGALGVVTRLGLDLVPTYEVTSRQYGPLDWPAYLGSFDRLTSAAASVSAFTRYGPDGVYQLWLKHKGPVSPQAPVSRDELFGAPAASEVHHMIPGCDVEAITEQLGRPGPWHERLPHFRPEFTPSNGAELQSDYLLPRERTGEAVEAMRALHERIDPLLQCAEIRTVAADELWLSGAYGRESVTLHFTWVLDTEAVGALLPDMERTLLPLGARPHWGKCFAAQREQLEPLYPRMSDFRELRDRLDPHRVFGNDFLAHTIGE